MTRSPEIQGPGQSPANLLVVVVDDDASFLRSMGRLLRSAGYAAATFGSGRELLASLPALSPHCLVFDIQMPGMTGLELYERLAAQGAALPVVFVTAYDTPQNRERARQFGSVDLLLKPFDREALLLAIQQVVDHPEGAGP